MIEFYVDTQKVKFIPTEIGLYLRRIDSENYFYLRLPVDTIWSTVKGTSLKKIKIDDISYKRFRLHRFREIVFDLNNYESPDKKNK